MGKVVEFHGRESDVSQLVAGVDCDIIVLIRLPINRGGAQIPRAHIFKDVGCCWTRHHLSGKCKEISIFILIEFSIRVVM
jgi:hypothetical protein